MKRSTAPTNRPASPSSSRMEKPHPVVAELAKQRRRIVSHQMLERILHHNNEGTGSN